MKLFFDARYIRTDLHDGISRFSAELGSALFYKTDVTFIVSDKVQISRLPEGAKFIMFHAPTSIMEPLSALKLNKYKPDIVVSPMQTIGSLGKKFKLALTVHDLIYYRHRKAPKNFSWFIRVVWRIYFLSYWPQRLTLNSSDMVLAVSETTKKDILSTKLTKRPVVVVHNAPASIKQPSKKPLKKIDNLVYMGAFIGYKNVETLIKGMEYLPECTLHLLSRISNKRKAELETLIPEGAKVIFYNGVSDDKYYKILADNAILVSASKDEGYGIPLAEALTMSVPVVVSDIPIFHEVAGEGGEYFDFRDPKDFAGKVNKMQKLDNYASRASRGQKHIKKFSWEKSAEALLNAIESNLLK